ncbi:MAG: CheW domain-containing protein [Polyangiaceae bacterium]|nr:CheW domain-containing protein [Polyangiaceae bacterium]MCW5791052.1 CheW domain-containing protein [Polyangiaceae bacterium]
MDGAAGGEASALGQSLDTRCICVVVSQSHYVLRLADVQEVIGLRPLTRVFHAPEVIAGVTSLRGEVLPVLDLGLLLGGASAGRGADARVVVARDRQRRRAGLLVDGLAGLREIPARGLAELPDTLSPQVRAVGAGMIPVSPPCVVLDVERVLSQAARREGSGAAAW